ncbi:TPA: flagellar basal body rod protein FlgC [Yersinia enterocolitica]|uniref:flagellar basal body rod protein FlgC n=1 Tax=Yersinia enterocolitica TaxID=630 RepID=UPI002AC78E20|nr:flagellar basal body rod protein FlgC [Yersinia enterocolitica]HEN3571149.1 flagellar basal body rod protein FlgC [Yersinia enterocolitica]HEN3575735.1 flagellar basal body rod protein FlgC [Yersinia enterocolitica]HEN3618172.1 flagellar basal body rod protein FlgC [Yersinia enterocolitica]HEN3630292.1 flagellar basal body rod protein FlgC [Yersinia enterocolitica]
MSFNNIYRISGSAMTAQTIRLNTIASNLANAESPAASAAEAYKARSPIFSAVYSPRSAANPRAASGAQVQVLDVVEVGETIQRYEPNHPLANPQGYVFYPAVNVVSEMADMMSASRSFETNVEVLNSVKSMQQSVLKLGER